jgi:hypothetical protein
LAPRSLEYLAGAWNTLASVRSGRPSSTNWLASAIAFWQLVTASSVFEFACHQSKVLGC